MKLEVVMAGVHEAVEISNDDLTAFSHRYRVRAGYDIVEVVGMQVGRYAVRKPSAGPARIATARNSLIWTGGYIVDHLELGITAVGNLEFDEALSAADSLSRHACDPHPYKGWAECDPHIHEWLCSVTLDGFVAYEAWREKRRLCRLPKKIDRIRTSKEARKYFYS